jgi:prevent-host-death family protein
MSMPITISDANASFPDLLKQVAQGNEVVIMENGKAIARLVPAAPPTEEEEAEERPWRGLFVPEPRTQAAACPGLSAPPPG